MSLFDTVAPTPVRGVIRIAEDCEHCHRPVPVFGLPGKGRPLDTFAPDYFCHGHAVMIRDISPVHYALNFRDVACGDQYDEDLTQNADLVTCSACTTELQALRRGFDEERERNQSERLHTLLERYP